MTPSESAQARLLPVSHDPSLLSPPSFPRQVPEPAPWRFTRRSSGVDTSHAENSQNPILIPHALENQSSLVAGYSRFPPAGFTDVIPELSSHTQDDPLDFLNPPSSSGMQVDSVTATPFPGPASPQAGALSQVSGHAPTQQATPPTSPGSQPEQQRLTGKRRRLSEPKDPRAAKRLRSQRQGDDENLEALYKLLVPSSAGVVQKKDRLGMSTSPLPLHFLDDGNEDCCCRQFSSMRKSGCRHKVVQNNIQQP
jgi:hypothetical protein